MNRAARRAAAAKQRRQQLARTPPSFDRAILLRMAAAMIADDPTCTGATLIMPDGEMTYLDAALLRRGGAA